MANATSRARAVNKQNTAVLYVDRSESGEVPVATARVVPVGAANAAKSGATLQLVAVEPKVPGADAQVVEVEPPRAAARQRPARPTRVIAYNVRIVAQADAPIGDEAYDAASAMQFAPTAEHLEMPQRLRGHLDDAQYAVPDSGARGAGAEHYAMPPRSRGHADDSQFVMPGRSARDAGVEHYAMPPRARGHADDARFVVPANSGHQPDAEHYAMPPRARRHADDDARFVMPGRGTREAGAEHSAMPNRERRTSHGVQYEMHEAARAPYDARFDPPNAAAMPFPPEGGRGRGPLRGSVPRGVFGALEDMGGRLHERTRRAATRAHEAALDGSYKQLLNMAGSGSLLSKRNLCIAVAAYATILFLLAAFTG